MPSLTIPDQALSVLDILQRHTSGRSIPSFNPEYQYDDNIEVKDTFDLPEINRLSKTDAAYLKEDIKDQITFKQNNINNMRRKRAKKEAKVLAAKQQKPSETSDADSIASKQQNDGQNRSVAIPSQL